MFLKSIKASKFRNYNNLKIEFLKGITVLKGENAQGKTNFLESVYFLATGKPVRAESDDEVIKFGEGAVNIEGVVIDDEKSETTLSSAIQKSEYGMRKKFLVNGIPRRLVDYAGFLNIVYFRPEDIDLVTGSPSLRREYIDSVISQVDKEYRKTLNAYLKLITQKNRLLKLIREGKAKSDELDFWNEKQLELGIILQRKRKDFFESINSFEKKFGEFEYKYLPSEINESRLSELFEKEIYAAVCLCGPHRDDFLFLEKDKQSLRSDDLKQSLRSDDLKQSLRSGDLKDLAKYGSRGEQRTSVLDLKITELSYFEKILKERPVLLLDDIFSELDISHRQHVIDLANLQQTIIATVEYDQYLKDALKDSQIIEVNNGVLK